MQIVWQFRNASGVCDDFAIWIWVYGVVSGSHGRCTVGLPMTFFFLPEGRAVHTGLVREAEKMDFSGL